MLLNNLDFNTNELLGIQIGKSLKKQELRLIERKHRLRVVPEKLFFDYYYLIFEEKKNEELLQDTSKWNILTKQQRAVLLLGFFYQKIKDFDIWYFCCHFPNLLDALEKAIQFVQTISFSFCSVREDFIKKTDKCRTKEDFRNLYDIDFHDREMKVYHKFNSNFQKSSYRNFFIQDLNKFLKENLHKIAKIEERIPIL
ncbi:hypothetical protein [Aureivirga sp. CE67]|uniref:hypothetical protein n=1 Tax=Aureivirga sp. CE67 TaxID=1788983 RepID=UPI0018CB2587|nr:hypothetical protein [Aureivirga sp. CE67]